MEHPIRVLDSSLPPSGWVDQLLAFRTSCKILPIVEFRSYQGLIPLLVVFKILARSEGGPREMQSEVVLQDPLLLLFRQLVEIGDAREVNFLRRLWLVSIRKGVLSAVNHLIVTFLFGSILRSNDFVVFTDAREASQRLEP